jgi:TetR/AcrR family tetracycline transcriptional repressor
MARIKREEIIHEALKLLDEEGLDGVSTRSLARRLGIESASLYWHFRNKSELLNEMSAVVLTRHHHNPPPTDSDNWPEFISNNARSFRTALLAHRDGARLHAGTSPTATELERILAKVNYLVRAGFTRREAGMVLYASSQFTIGCVLEEQVHLSHGAEDRKHTARKKRSAAKTSPSIATETRPSAGEAFEFGLNLFVQGLEVRMKASA